METYSQIILLIFLIILSGFFSSSETALTGFKMTKLKKVEEENENIAKLLKLWLKKPNEFLTAILIGNNIVNILASSIATTLAITLIGNNANTILLVTGIMTIIILIFGEITPKIIAKNYPTKISMSVIRIINILNIIFYPITKILIFVSRIISKFFGVELNENKLLITEEDIKSFVNVGKDEGVLEEEEQEMIHSIFEFGDTTVKEVMIPRTTMFVLEGSQLVKDIWDDIIDSGFSRIPVYEEKIDNIIGIIYVKDLFTVIKENKLHLPIKNFVREAYFVPETKELDALLKEFKKAHIHIAMVVDEYGGINGLVTIEDLIEEIIGEISDEFDDDDDGELIKKLSDFKYLVNAMISIDDLDNELNINIPISDDYDTLGGFIYSVLGRIPVINDTITHENLTIRVMKIEERRIDKVLIIINNTENNGDKGE
ncbi:putative hemolysin [Hypnocyclicus thermotrophus]|uniref:Hemolysin n=1 Tax=Hypnocyclicus thermotrophus TaxID=1627895 RepID=A0AA46DY48_9FUSO|nr:hemolysin family protein [Hypnocyclicus thermotrophus]TDT68651.1 putative hemolysin [Hypnocyclicus thermotrophus]